MKVLHYASSLSRSAGGLYYSVSGICRALADLGVEITVCGGADEDFAQDKTIWGDLKIYPHKLYTRYGFAPGVFKTIRAIRPDIVHIHGIWSAASIYGRYASMSGANTVVSPRGMLDPWILSRRSPIKKVHAALFETPLLAKSYLHALNTGELEAAVSFAPSLRHRSFVIPNGIPDIEISQSSEKSNEILYIGRLHEKKQVLELVRAWRKLPLEQNYKLIIAGWGDKHYEQQLIHDINGCAQISFVGSLYGAEKAAALSRAQFFILPSLSEGLPMAVLEAIQYGCIPIITDECNLPQMFTDGIALRMATNFTDFANVIQEATHLSLSEQKARTLASMKYATKYVWPQIAKSMLEKYHGILKQDASHR